MAQLSSFTLRCSRDLQEIHSMHEHFVRDMMRGKLAGETMKWKRVLRRIGSVILARSVIHHQKTHPHLIHSPLVVNQAHSNIGYIATLCLNLTLLIPLAGDPKVNNYVIVL